MRQRPSAEPYRHPPCQPPLREPASHVDKPPCWRNVPCREFNAARRRLASTVSSLSAARLAAIFAASTLHSVPDDSITSGCGLALAAKIRNLAKPSNRRTTSRNCPISAKNTLPLGPADQVPCCTIRLLRRDLDLIGTLILDRRLSTSIPLLITLA